MMSFDLLSEPIRRFIRDKGWSQLTSIQNGAIPRIIGSDDNFILVSRTASGKTEAAFLPILSKVNFMEPGVQVLYISPLIALINDQFNRVEELCKYLDVDVTKWHGEANRTIKEKLVKKPNGIVLITPESIEAMFVHRPYQVAILFSQLKYVVIDEIHSFIGSYRGIQLQSLLSRLRLVNNSRFSTIGLSATMSEENKFHEVKSFTGEEELTKILIDRKPKEIKAVFRYFEGESEQLPVDLIKDIYRETCNSKVLIFPNSRGRAEEVAVRLKRISDKLKGHSNYFSHHSSVDREVREYVEYFAKNNSRQNFCISCTSTLELGIDIGSVDEVVQIDSTFSIASLIQRVGRSGRQDGKDSNLFLYATSQWSLLQAVACWLLFREGFIEPPQTFEKPYDVLIHQAMSITKGTSGILIPELIRQLKFNAAFKQIDSSEIREIIDHLVNLDLLEQLQQEVIIGVEGEKLVNSRHFYSMFQTEEQFKVLHAGNPVGEIPHSGQVKENENILLAARIWKIKFVDEKAKRIEVIPASDGKKPLFFGGGGNVHQRIREKMLEIVYSGDNYSFLNDKSSEQLESLRGEFRAFQLFDLSCQRPLNIGEKRISLFTFQGSIINRTIHFLLSAIGIHCNIDEDRSVVEILNKWDDLKAKWGTWRFSDVEIDGLIREQLNHFPGLLRFSKWAEYLPVVYQVKLIRNSQFDVEAALRFLDRLVIVKNE